MTVTVVEPAELRIRPEQSCRTGVRPPTRPAPQDTAVTPIIGQTARSNHIVPGGSSDSLRCRDSCSTRVTTTWIREAALDTLTLAIRLR